MESVPAAVPEVSVSRYSSLDYAAPLGSFGAALRAPLSQILIKRDQRLSIFGRGGNEFPRLRITRLNSCFHSQLH